MKDQQWERRDVADDQVYIKVSVHAKETDILKPELLYFKPSSCLQQLTNMCLTLLKTLFLLYCLPILVAGGTLDLTGTLPNVVLDILKTTTTEHHTIDWIPLHSQGHIAQAPPARAAYVPDPTKNVTLAASELQHSNAELGPPGTVPIPRANLTPKDSKDGLPTRKSSKENSKRQYAGDHWYCSSDLSVNNYGGSGIFSAYKAFVQNNADFSLLQTAVVVGSTSQGEQTVEAGWINYPNQVAAPHIFTYYTTDGYAGNGNNVGGWNREVGGWVQYSSTIFPGTYFTPLSTIDGAQYEITMEYEYWEGNWWLSVQNQWIGYYPGSLFTISGETTLADYADLIFFYGEIYQSEAALTTTDMGSGEFGTLEWPWSAYIHNIWYYDLSYDEIAWDGSFWCSDTSRYNEIDDPNSGSGWGSFVYLGGPGAGGVVGG